MDHYEKGGLPSLSKLEGNNSYLITLNQIQTTYREGVLLTFQKYHYEIWMVQSQWELVGILF